MLALATTKLIWGNRSLKCELERHRRHFDAEGAVLAGAMPFTSLMSALMPDLIVGKYGGAAHGRRGRLRRVHRVAFPIRPISKSATASRALRGQIVV